MKFSDKKPLVHSSTKQYYENKSLQELRDEFEKIMRIREIAHSYKPKKPKK